jgi:hypothetical protein
MRYHRATCLLVLAAATTAPANGIPRSHNGFIVDASTGKPIERAAATAYGANTQKASSGTCPKYDDYLDEKKTTGVGAFQLAIPDDKPSYLVTYCHEQYVTFTTEGNDNTRDKTPIDPSPVRMFLRNGGVAEMTAAISSLQGDTASAAIAEREASGAAFSASLATLPAAERKVFATWTGDSFDKKRKGQRPRTMEWKPGRDTTSDLQRLARMLRNTLAYFATANTRAFRSAIADFPEMREYAQQTDILRGRD